jgi:hypothetical protein
LTASVTEIGRRCTIPATSPTRRWHRRNAPMRASPSCRRPPSASATSCSSSRRSPSRPTCSRSMPRSRRRVPAKPAAGSRWWLRR